MTMFRSLLLTATLVLAASPALAQAPRADEAHADARAQQFDRADHAAAARATRGPNGGAQADEAHLDARQRQMDATAHADPAVNR